MPPNNVTDFMDDELSRINILHRAREQTTSTPGLKLNYNPAEEVADKGIKVPNETIEKAEGLAITWDDIMDQVVQLRLDFQKMKSEQVPYELEGFPNQPLDSKHQQVLGSNPNRFELTFVNIGANPLYWDVSEGRLKQYGGFTLVAGASYTIRVQSGIWMFSPNGTSVDVYEKNYKVTTIAKWMKEEK